MERQLFRSFWHLMMAFCVACSGCSALATIAWVATGGNVPAEFSGLVDKKVAVVCSPSYGSLYAYPNVGKDLARRIAILLRRNVRKIRVIDPQKVDEWMDENTWNEYPEVGKALGADMVVAVDINNFRIHEGQTIYQGRADVILRVYDCKTGEVVFEKHPPEIVYPPNHVVSAAEVSEREFREEFLGILAEQLARHFYPHDPRANFALDAKYIH